MHIPWLFYIVWGLFFLYVFKRKLHDKKPLYDGDFACIISALVFLSFFWFFVSAVLATVGWEKVGERSETIEIVAMKPEQSPQKGIFLLSGNLAAEKKGVYHFLRKSPDGSTILERLDTKNCSISEEYIESGHLIRHDNAMKREALNIFGKFFLFRYVDDVRWWRGTRAEFYVPKGSVVQGVNIDLKDFK